MPPLRMKESTPKSTSIGPSMASTGPKEKTVEVQVHGEAEEETTKKKISQKKPYLEEQPKTWANILDSHRLSAKGMRLNSVAPVMKTGEKIIKLNKDGIEKAMEE
ncbi:hypothetical protein FXO38_33338 [Capsicum annuum]|nr:hypothetical protein FXO38_33338 [Capsicum annuum]KAF3671044.1 hypothetical protein FXO37_08235 [Capsicum annuum]